MKFSNNQELKSFIQNLIEILDEMGEDRFVDDLRSWSIGVFTTSSECLGELKIILEIISNQKMLNDSIQKEVVDCIDAINKAFGIK